MNQERVVSRAAKEKRGSGQLCQVPQEDQEGRD